MKKLLFFGFALWISVSHAQYFTNTYGNAVLDPTQLHGFNTVLNPGHVISDVMLGTAGVLEPEVIKTDILGVQVFGKHYTVFVGGVPVNAGFTPKVFELPDMSGYGVVGTCKVNVGGTMVNRPFYYQVDLTGTPKGGGSYYNAFATTSADIGGGSNVCISVISANQFLLACGNNNPAGSFTVLKIDIGTRAVIASGLIAVPNTTAVTTEMIEVNQYNAAEIVVGGNLTFVSSGNIDAYAAKLDLATLAPVAGPALTYFTAGGATDRNQIFSIRPMLNTGIAPPLVSPGFILGGTYLSSVPGSKADMWALALDPSFNVIKSVTLDDGLDNSGYDMIERFSVINNQYEYYIAGWNYDPSIPLPATGNNTEIMKLTSTLSMGGSIIFNSSSNVEMGFKIDQLNNMATGGLSLFGVRNTNQLSITKLYFNGFTPCTYRFSSPIISPLPCTTQAIVIKKSDLFNDMPLSVIGTSMVWTSICSASSVPGGSNAKVLKDEGITSSVLMPNPAKANEVLVIQFQGLESSNGGVQQVSVSIFDLAGKSFYEGNVTVNADHRMELNLGNMNLKEGMYLLRVTGEGIEEHKVLRITN